MDIEPLMHKLASPAQRAIRGAGITTLEQLAAYSEKEIAALHGVGKNAMSIIKETLREHGLSFAEKK